MGVFSDIFKSVGSVIGDKISASFDSTPVGNLLHEDKPPVQKAPVVFPPISENTTVIETYCDKNLSFKTLNPTTFWDTHDNFCCGLTTVFAFSPNGVALENWDDPIPDGLIAFGTPDNPSTTYEEAKSRIENMGDNLNTQVFKLSNQISLYKMIGESNEKYIEINYMELDYEGSPCGYEVYIDINKNKFSYEQIEIMKHEYHTIINTMTLSDI